MITKLYEQNELPLTTAIYLYIQNYKPLLSALDEKEIHKRLKLRNPTHEDDFDWKCLKNKIYNDTELSGSAVNGFTGTSTYTGNDYRLGVSEKEQTHKGHCTGEKGTAVTTFSQPPSILTPEEVLSVDVKVSYSKSDGHPQGVNLQTTVRFMWEPHVNSYTYLRTDDDQYNIMPQQEHTTEGGKDTGYHTFSSCRTGRIWSPWVLRSRAFTRVISSMTEKGFLI